MKLIVKLSLIILSSFTICSCGVKGRPLPPEEATTLGYGRPQRSSMNQASPDGTLFPSTEENDWETEEEETE